MTHPSHLDPATLAATLRLWVLGLVVWLADRLKDGPLGDALHRWAMRQLDRAERGAEAIAVLAALALLPAPAPVQRAAARPLHAPRGFARVPVRGNDMRRMTRHLFLRERDPVARAARLNAFLQALPQHAQHLARRIERTAPGSRLIPLAPPETPCAARIAALAPAACDTS